MVACFKIVTLSIYTLALMMPPLLKIRECFENCPHILIYSFESPQEWQIVSRR